MKPHDDPGCYMLCFTRPLDTGCHPRHYVGSAARIGARVLRHRLGSDARLLQVVAERGIDWEVSRVWITANAHVARLLEKKLKAHHFKSICPLCGGEVAYKRARYEKVRKASEIEDAAIPF